MVFFFFFFFFFVDALSTHAKLAKYDTPLICAVEIKASADGIWALKTKHMKTLVVKSLSMTHP